MPEGFNEEIRERIQIKGNLTERLNFYFNLNLRRTKVRKTFNA